MDHESEGPGKIRLFFRNNENAQSELHIVSSDRYDDYGIMWFS